MQTSFPDAVIGNMCPYPVRMCVVIVSTNFPVFKVIYVTAKCSIMGKELRKSRLLASSGRRSQFMQPRARTFAQHCAVCPATLT